MGTLIAILIVGYIVFKLIGSVKKSSENKSTNEMMLSKFNKQIEANPYDARAYFLRGCCYQSLHNYRLAIEDFTEALELNPENNRYKFVGSDSTFDNTTILRNRSSAKSSIGDRAGAKKDLELIQKFI